MATVIIKEQNTIVLQSEVQNITPLGFDCEFPMERIQELRDESGRFRVLEFALTINTFSGNSTIKGTVSIYSVRRASQTRCTLTARFVEMEQGGYRLISEHIGQSVAPVGVQQAVMQA